MARVERPSGAADPVTAARKPRDDEGRLPLVRQVGLAEPLGQLPLLEALEVDQQGGGQGDDEGRAGSRPRGDRHAQVGQDGPQRHRIAAVAERTLRQQLLGGHHRQRRAPAPGQLGVDGPEAEREPEDRQKPADDAVHASDPEGRQTEPAVEAWADPGHEEWEQAQEDGAHKERGRDPRGLAVLSLGPRGVAGHVPSQLGSRPPWRAAHAVPPFTGKHASADRVGCQLTATASSALTASAGRTGNGFTAATIVSSSVPSTRRLRALRMRLSLPGT